MGVRTPKSPAHSFYRRCPYASQHPLFPCQAEPRDHLRPGVDVEGAHFIAIPAHGLEGGIVIAQLSFPAQEVLLVVDGEPGVAVVLQAQKTASDLQAPGWKPRSCFWPPHPCSYLPRQPSLQTFWKGKKATGTWSLTRGIPFALPEILLSETPTEKIIMEQIHCKGVNPSLGNNNKE